MLPKVPEWGPRPHHYCRRRAWLDWATLPNVASEAAFTLALFLLRSSLSQPHVEVSGVNYLSVSDLLELNIQMCCSYCDEFV